MQSEKMCVVLLFGGMSSEHEVSCVSVGNFVRNIDRSKYEVLTVGITIILGAIISMAIEDTGAAKVIANFFIKLFRGKRMELAPALTAFIMSIPVLQGLFTFPRNRPRWQN